MTEEKYIRVSVNCPEHGETIELAAGVFVICAYAEKGDDGHTYARYARIVHRFPKPAADDVNKFWTERFEEFKHEGPLLPPEPGLRRKLAKKVKGWIRARRS